MARTISLKGQVFADDASTVIPSTPVSGTPYRNSSLSGDTVRRGWPYSQVVDSADFNQFLWQLSAFLNEVERNGGLEYSALTDYEAGNVCRYDNQDGSAGLYRCLSANGPSSQVVSPIGGEGFWSLISLLNGGGGGGGTGDGARRITASSAASVTVGIGDAYVCTPSAGLEINADLKDMYAGYADVFVTVPSGQTVTAGSNCVFGANESVTAGKINHIKVEFQGLDGARMYVVLLQLPGGYRDGFEQLL